MRTAHAPRAVTLPRGIVQPRTKVDLLRAHVRLDCGRKRAVRGPPAVVKIAAVVADGGIDHILVADSDGAGVLAAARL
jgi:hypothetical protein